MNSEEVFPFGTIPEYLPRSSSETFFLDLEDFCNTLRELSASFKVEGMFSISSFEIILTKGMIFIQLTEKQINNVEFVPTYGSIQGADYCLQTLQCSAFDTASLLIALLRVSGIPARYVYGTIELPIDKFMNWMGGFTDPNSAITFAASGGIPGQGLTAGGKIVAVQIEHVWVEVYVPYGNYRGTMRDDSIKTWIPMDGSFKQYEYTQGIDFFQIADFDAEAFLNEVKANSTYNEAESYITDIDQTLINQKIDEISTILGDYIQTNMPDATMPDILDSRRIINREYGILSGSLPYKTIAVLSRFSEIPNNLRYKITFRAYDPSSYGLSGELSYQITLPEVAGKRITLSYTAATDSDRAVIEQYGDISAVPAYLVSLKPLLKINGIIVAEGPPIGLGNDMEFVMSFINASGRSESVQYTFPVGGYHAITLDISRISKQTIENIATNFQTLIDVINSGQGDIYPDDIFGEMLHSVGALYFYEADALNKLTSNLIKVRTIRHPSGGVTSTVLKVSYMFSIPMNVAVTGLNIDVKRDIESSVSLEGDKNNVLAYRIQSGMNGSMMEHMIYENLFQQEGISAVKVLQIANQEGIPIYQITQDNISQVLSNLQLSFSIKTDIQNLINAGYTVAVPQQSISYNGWNGTGYIAIDPDTGDGGYIIEGGSAGGDTTGWWALGAASNALLAIASILRKGESVPISNILKYISPFVSYFAIGYKMIDTLIKVENAKISQESKNMLSAMIIGLFALLFGLKTVSLLFIGLYGIAVIALLSAYMSLILNVVIPEIILTVEIMENYNRRVP